MLSVDRIEKDRAVSEVIMVWLTAAAAVAILPFAVLRLVKEQWLIASLDGVIFLGMAALCLYVLKTGKTQLACWVMSFLSIAGMLITVQLKGETQFVWAYPATVAIYYLVKPNQAAAINLSAIIVLGAISYSNMTIATFGSSMITLIATNVFAFIFSSRTNQQRDLLIQQATKDPLTKTGNRRAFDLEITQLVKQQQRSASDMSMISIDIDNFKEINDKYGHAKGDEVLRLVSQILTLRLRGTDNLYRIGGEEFVIIPVNTDLKNAEKLSEQLRTLIEASELIPEQPLTISLGLAEYRANENEQEWLARADKALYQAKNSGKNKTCISD
ncbi:MAG: GGDEF domain-containing protein [Oceanicoccus sp.]